MKRCLSKKEVMDICIRVANRNAKCEDFCNDEPKMFDRVEWTNLLFDRIHEDDFRIFSHFTDPTECIIDVGGLSGCSAASIHASGSSAQVLTFEPFSSYEPHLREVKRIYTKFKKTFDYRILGLSDSGGEGGGWNFMKPVVNGVGMPGFTTADIEALHPESLSDFVFVYAEKYLGEKDVVGFHFYKFVSNVEKLDVVLKNDTFSVSLDRIAAIKIDVEGHEFNVLNGASKTIAMHRPLLLIEGGHRNNNVMNFLCTGFDSSGSGKYLPCSRIDSSLMPGKISENSETNCFFVSIDRIPEYKSKGIIY